MNFYIKTKFSLYKSTLQSIVPPLKERVPFFLCLFYRGTLTTTTPREYLKEGGEVVIILEGALDVAVVGLLVGVWVVVLQIKIKTSFQIHLQIKCDQANNNNNKEIFGVESLQFSQNLVQQQILPIIEISRIINSNNITS